MSNAAPLDPEIVAQVRAALSLAQRGDLAQARAVAERALALGRDQAAVRGVLGMLCCQAGDLRAGIDHLHAALREMPDDMAVAANLSTALIQNGDVEEALGICTAAAAGRDPSRRLWRLRAYATQVREDYAAAAEAYRQVVAGSPGDFESWNNLGNALAAVGDPAGSIEALERAAALRPDIAPVRLNLATTLMEVGRWDDALQALAACVRDFPDDSKPLVEMSGLLKQLGRDEEAISALERATLLEPENADLRVSLGMERMVTWAMKEAEEAFRTAIALNPSHAEATIMLAILLEHANRADEFPALIASAEAAGVNDGAVQFLRALDYRRERRFDEALAALANVPDDVEPVRRAHLIGQCHDRLDDPQAAFAAFSEMNRLLALDPTEPLVRAEEYRAGLRQDRAVVTEQWYGRWRPAGTSDGRASPVFLVGFPRSGTTLLDTILMGHPKVRIMEERPALRQAGRALDGIDRLAELGVDEIHALRERYFREAAKYGDTDPGTLLVDKFPLHLNKVPLIHRLFPDARFILALRHPCDVVLSCFITNFRLNSAMSNFLDLEDSARLYDSSFGFWEQCRAIMSIHVHEISYERMIADGEAELRPLFDYLDLEWHRDVLDHRRTAAGRGIISTASYSQVTEPIYDRAAGRWTRYRDQLAPVLPILQPWVERFGYTL